MMLFRRQSETSIEFDAEVAALRTTRFRRGMAILCVVYIVLGIVDAGFFRFAYFEGLLVTRTQAVTHFESLQAEAAAGTVFDAPEGDDVAADTEDPLTTAELEAEKAVAAVRRAWARLGACGLGIAVIAGFLVHLRRRLGTAAQVSNAATLMILLLGAVLLASRLMAQQALPNIEFTWLGLVDLVVLQLAACLIMPWSAKESTLPFVPLLLIWALTFLVPGASDWPVTDRVVLIIVSPVLLAPGAGIAAWRLRRRREEVERQILEGRVLSYGGELSRARIVHDAMFPRDFTGHISFEYEYQPIHEIGGDYVHTHVCDDGRVTVTLLDVAGHGLAAALTVNRLFGELERILAENATAQPGEVMTLLNRYIYLTMARHSMYATGTCMMLDPLSGELKWVSAGHPPSLVRHVGGSVNELPTTAVLLGALEPEIFDAGQESTVLRPGEVVIAYTDGAFEARDATGHRFGLDRVRETARFDPPPRSWPKFIAGAVAQHHEGHAEDDVLIASLTLRSLRVADVAEARFEKAVVREGLETGLGA